MLAVGWVALVGLVCVASYRLGGVVIITFDAGPKDPGSNPGRGILFNANFIHSGNLRLNLQTIGVGP